MDKKSRRLRRSPRINLRYKLPKADAIAIRKVLIEDFDFSTWNFSNDTYCYLHLVERKVFFDSGQPLVHPISWQSAVKAIINIYRLPISFEEFRLRLVTHILEGDLE